MNIYFIDYENVTSQGLKGIELLTEADEVNLLYSKKAETMKIDMLTQLMASRANIRFLPVHVGTPNALDFQLITLLFLHYTDGNNYYIISKDSGYDCCIKTALENDAPNVFRFPNIESAINGGQKPKSQRSRRGSRQNSQNNSQAASQAQKAVQEQKAAQAHAVQEAAQDADNKQALVADTVQVQESISSQVQDLNNTPVQDLINAPAQSQDTADAQEAVADAEAAASEDSGDSGRKRTARRRGRRKSSSASQSETGSSEESAEVSKELKEEVHEEPSQAKENQNQKQNQQARKNQNQKQNQQAKDSQNHNQKQSQQNRDNQNQKPVTILSVIRRRNDVQLDLNQIDLIRAALKNTANKQQFYNYFAKKLGQKKGIELYHSINSSYTDLINANLI